MPAGTGEVRADRAYGGHSLAGSVRGKRVVPTAICDRAVVACCASGSAYWIAPCHATIPCRCATRCALDHALAARLRCAPSPPCAVAHDAHARDGATANSYENSNAAQQRSAHPSSTSAHSIIRHILPSPVPAQGARIDLVAYPPWSKVHGTMCDDIPWGGRLTDTECALL